MEKDIEYCKCVNCLSIYIDDNEWGYWEVCGICRKRVEDSYKSYNHYDGKDNVDDPYDAY